MPTGQYVRKSPGKRIKLKCEVCEKEMEFLESVLRVRKIIRFCSTKCMGESMRKGGTKVEVICTECGAKFSKRADHASENNFCSRSCSAKNKRVEGAKWRDPCQIKEYMAEYTKRNREKLTEQGRNWFEANADKKLQIQKKYREKNKAYLAMAARARRFGMKAGSFTLDEWNEITRKYENKCLCCNRQEPEILLEVDHVISFKAGGTHDASNIQPLCRSCNARKGARTIDYR